MARKSRIKDTHGTFLIQQSGGSERPLFTSDEDRLRFLGILKNAQNQFSFRLKGFCLSEANGYRILMDVNGGDISKIMKSINIAYGMYAKCEGNLFKDRYKSTLLETPQALVEAESCMRQEKALESPWNTYCTATLEIKPELKVLLESQPEEAPCTDCMTNVEEAMARLSRIQKEDGRPLQAIFKDKPYRNHLIRLFRQHSTLSLKELGQIFGDVSESSVSKILKG